MSAPTPTAAKPAYRVAAFPPPGSAVHTIDVFDTPAKILSDAKDAHSVSASAPSYMHDALAVRIEVFKFEQKCLPDLEIDEEDDRSFHWVIYTAPLEAKAGLNNDEDIDPRLKTNSVEAVGRSQHLGEIPVATIRFVTPAPAGVDGTIAHEPQGFGTVRTPWDQWAVENGKSIQPSTAGSKMWDLKEPYAKIGRLATLKKYRGRGYAKMLVLGALKWAKEHPKEVAGAEKSAWRGLVQCHGQIQLKEWYTSLGFQVDEGLGTWWEEGLEHVGMWLRLDLEAS